MSQYIENSYFDGEWNEAKRILMRIYMHSTQTDRLGTPCDRMRDLKVFMLRHKHNWAYKYIGEKFGFSIERARQIDLRVCRRLIRICGRL